VFAQIALINCPSSNIQKAREFYGGLLGIPFGRSLWDEEPSYHAPIDDGLMMTIGLRHHPEERLICYFQVDDITEATRRVTELGGQVLWGPAPLQMSSKVFDGFRSIYEREYADLFEEGIDLNTTMGTSALVLDTEGNAIGLLQLARHAQVFFRGGPGTRSGLGEKQLRIQMASIQVGERLERLEMLDQVRSRAAAGEFRSAPEEIERMSNIELRTMLGGYTRPDERPRELVREVPTTEGRSKRLSRAELERLSAGELIELVERLQGAGPAGEDDEN